MSSHRPLVLDLSMGKQEVDSTGPPIGVVRMSVEQSYGGVGELLQETINGSGKEAWENIKAKIDYLYAKLDLALAPLEAETGFSREVRSRLKQGQKMLFKPNLVNIFSIHPQTHGPDGGSTACTEWPFVAALMRWFHDQMGFSYHQMALGEAASTMPAAAGYYSLLKGGGKAVTPEAVIEGKVEDFYGGWGFYFARKYLAERLAPGRTDDPMKGYEESVQGVYIPPGYALDKLMVYDLNRIFDDPSKGREVDVPDGVNYRSIALHKVIVGGDPDDPEDRKAYPGSILINVPKLKVHCFTLLTNVIKNLGIGLYPMQCAKEGGHHWDYSCPNVLFPGMKGKIPHQVWVPMLDTDTGLPRRDAAGSYMVEKTGGITATMVDIVQAVIHQDVLMIHVVDAIEAINLDHQGLVIGVKVPEGMVFAALDPVAADLLSARYMFSNVPLVQALQTDVDDGAGGRFPQAVPVPRLEGNQILTQIGFDCPLARDKTLLVAEQRGLGERRYHTVGHDAVTDCPIVSIQGHLGAVQNGNFVDLITQNLYFDVYKMPWDLQKTAFGYLEAVDRLTGSSLKKEFLDAFDEDGDGVVTYEEFGKKGVTGSMMWIGGETVSRIGSEPRPQPHASFRSIALITKYSNPMYNPDGHDVFKELMLGAVCVTALQMSQMEMESPDFFCAGLTWGQGKWPSFQLAQYAHLGLALYGRGFPNKIGYPSLYVTALFHADMTQNNGRFGGEMTDRPDLEGLRHYISQVASGEEKPLDFTLYVPGGYDNLGGIQLPHVEVTSDPALIFTAQFDGGKEIWPRERISS